MDNNFYQDEFEQFLQDEVKQHRMYPSDHIWKNIRTEIHGNSAWPALTFISLFIISALTVSTLLINHPALPVAHNGLPAVVAKNTAVQDNHTAVSASTEATNNFQQITPEQITAETFTDQTEYNPEAELFVSGNIIHDHPATPVRTGISVNRQSFTDNIITKELPVTEQLTIQNTLITASDLAQEDNILYASNTTETTEAVNETITHINTEAHPAADDFLKDFAPVVNVTPQKKNSKFGFQFYITPSTSYRRLSDEKVKEIIQPAVAAAMPSQNVPLSANYSAGINDVVRHKPAMGLELGFAVMYNMTDRLKFKTGFQLNVRQYYIETFQTSYDIASLSLINYRGVETISFYTPYNNNTGYKQTRLDNKLYQVSVPLGIQWDLIQGKRLGISTEASVQPTMTLNKNTYLMSTDYKHYADGNDFIRKWNINTSLGLNITYKTGATTWHLGPQIRYQHLPTYSNIYPIKEYLMDYGVRLGFTRQIK